MQTVSLLRGLGEDTPTSRFAIDRTQLITAAAPQMTIAEMQSGTCSADGQFVWVASTPTTSGHWQRLRAGETCQSFAPGAGPNMRDQRGGAGGGGGVTVTDEQGNVVDTKVTVPPESATIWAFDARLQAGKTQLIEVGPFRFPADVERAEYVIWGTHKLPREIQDAITHAWKAGPDQMPMLPGLAWYFDNPPPTYSRKFFQPIEIKGPDTFGKRVIEGWLRDWRPVIKVKHPITGKDYGVFMSYLPPGAGRDHRDPSTLPADTPGHLTFLWAPIEKKWYQDVWDWIKEFVGKIVDFVCGKLSDPALAATTAAAASAGGPVTIGVATGATLLCQKPPPGQPTEDLPPAVEPKAPTWPYFLAGGLALVGVVAFLLIPPKKKPT